MNAKQCILCRSLLYQTGESKHAYCGKWHWTDTNDLNDPSTDQKDCEDFRENVTECTACSGGGFYCGKPCGACNGNGYE